MNWIFDGVLLLIMLFGLIRGYRSGLITLLFKRFRGLADAQLNNPALFGLCYTQLTDVEQEQNGLYTYDRRPKFDTARLHAILSRKAAVEED